MVKPNYKRETISINNSTIANFPLKGVKVFTFLVTEKFDTTEVTLNHRTFRL